MSLIRRKKGKGRWKKGQSGNPGGRPKTVGAIRLLAQEHRAKAFEELVGIMESKKTPPRVRLAAIELILAYSDGRPPQAMEVSGRDGKDVVLRVIHE